MGVRFAAAAVAVCPALVGVALAAPLSSPPPNSAVAYYPAAALAAGEDGTASIRCQRDAKSAYVGCTLVSEEPAGRGFGAAALAIAANAPPRATMALAPEDMALELPFKFKFTAKPPSVRPDLFLPPVSPPRWLTHPSTNEFASAYPTHAARAGLGGRTDMTCRVDDSGSMEDCKIDDETPPGLGFGAAALKLSRYFKLTTSWGDGFPTLGAKIHIPIIWKPWT